MNDRAQRGRDRGRIDRDGGPHDPVDTEPADAEPADAEPVDPERADRERAVELVQGLVAIPSLSGAEGEAARWLASRMTALGLERSRVDEVGNAVGELGEASCRRVVVLLGHIDTVPGEIPVRIERPGDGDAGDGVLHGRGAVDAKGPLACFVASAARLGPAWAREHDLRLVVAGAVEEEAATSRGARYLARVLVAGDGTLPLACVIGEPSRAHRITLGYKGRLLIDLEIAQPCAHTAGPDPGVAVGAIELWNELDRLAAAFNAGRLRPFDQLLPSVRDLATTSDGLSERVQATFGLRLPVGYDVASLHAELVSWAERRLTGADRDHATAVLDDLLLGRDERTLALRFRGYEPAHRSDKGSDLVRCFLRAIRRHAREREQVGFVLKTGTSDMNVVAPLWRCPMVAYGPGDSALDHTPHERLELDEYWQAVLTLESALREMAQST
ncbi:MAG TPA: M20/M25/M40 family metallo-hydrolase [Thermoanaerobaculia bacterium]|nr:M20/M25/M40 family metallo-hydrolase [Thermoanaerobaculia bacterium]